MTSIRMTIIRMTIIRMTSKYASLRGLYTGKQLLRWVLILLAIPGSVLISLNVGAVDLPVDQVLRCLYWQCDSSLVQTVVWDIRLPRVLMGLLVGAGLALAGAILQICTRNPLADPYLFGIVSGAGLGAVIATLILPESLNLWLPVFAFFGALISVFLVLMLSKFLMRIDLILLGGVAIGFMLGAISQFLLYLGEPFATNRIIFWLMGSLANVELFQTGWLALILLFTLLLSLMMNRQLDALMLDDVSAESLGINSRKLRNRMLVVCALLTAIIVAWCGGIGFVGLMIPHIARALWGTSTLRLLVGSVLLGGIFLLWVDLAARQLLTGQEIPIGIITAAVGSLFFISIMVQTSIKKG